MRIEPGKKIAIARKYQRPSITQGELAASLGIARETLAKYESGEYNTPHKTLLRIAALTGFPISWFVDGQDSPIPPQNPGIVAESSSVIDSMKDVLKLPYWGEVPCGNWEMPTSDPDTEEVSGTVREIKGDLRVVKVGGKSMEPDLRKGQKVVIALGPNAHDGQGVLVENQDRELSLKIYRVINGKAEFHSANPNYPPLTAESITIIGRVVHVEQTDPNGIYFA